MAATYTREEVAKHNKVDDAWVIIDDNVYDVTRFSMLHPGGEKILLDLAGNDVSEDFYGLHRVEVLDKYNSRLIIGKVQGADPTEKIAEGLTSFSRISKIRFAENGFWQGMKSTYYNQSHLELRKEVRAFYDKEVLAEALDGEETDTPPTAELHKKLGDYGLIGMNIGPGPHLKLCNKLPAGIKAEEFDYFHELIVHEEQSRLMCPGFEDGMTAGMNISIPPVIVFGTEKMKKELLPKLISGEKRSCLAITEPFAGSDVAGLRCTAKLSADGTHYIVNGVKKWITNGTFCDIFITAVRTGGPGAGGISMLLIERSEGLRTKLIKTSYSTAAGTSYVIYEDVKVPVENLMSKENKGFQAVMYNFNHERWMICAGLLARCRFVTEDCFKWATQRKVFGKSLVQQPVIREKLAKMVAELESVYAWMEAITFQMTQMSYTEQSQKLGGTIALLKYQSTKVATFISDEAVQIFGGRGITKTGMGRNVERFQRSNKFAAVYGGSEEIMADLGIRQSLKGFPRESKL